LSRLLIKNGTVVSSSRQELADVLIEGGRILRVAEGIMDGADETLNARGLHVLPGVTDPQVHFRDPGLTHKEDLHTGSLACAAGGVTSFYEMPNTKPATTTRDLMAQKKAMAAQKCVVNYGFFIGATASNLEELNAVENVAGIKIFMGSSTGDLLVDDPAVLEKIFASGRRLIAVHAEDEARLKANKAKFPSPTLLDHPRLRDAQAALLATRRAVSLAEKYGRRLHILHLTSADEAVFLAEHRRPYISVETCPQHLILSWPEAYERLGSLAQMNPPIREKSHGEALWKALHEGTIQCIATDHAPHTLEEKKKPYPESPSGMPGVETSLPLMLDQADKGRCSVQDVVRWMCENPPALYGAAKKGKIAPDFDADITLVDLKKKKRVGEGGYKTKVSWSPFSGMSLTGWPVFTLVCGQVVCRDGVVDVGVRGQPVLFT
jgi:dihydroorotase